MNELDWFMYTHIVACPQHQKISSLIHYKQNLFWYIMYCNNKMMRRQINNEVRSNVEVLN